MFSIDARLRGVPANKDQVVALHQSLNSPHLAIPGKQAGPAQAFIVGVRGGNGFAIFVYLFLAEVGDCAVYVSDQRNLTSEQFKDEENEAVAFVESMGFMMDNANFRSQPAERQEEMIRTLPVFQKEPRKPAPAASSSSASKGSAAASTSSSSSKEPAPVAAASLGKLFTSF